MLSATDADAAESQVNKDEIGEEHRIDLPTEPQQQVQPATVEQNQEQKSKETPVTWQITGVRLFCIRIVQIFWAISFKWCLPRNRRRVPFQPERKDVQPYCDMNEEQRESLKQVLMDMAFALALYSSASFRVEYHINSVATRFKFTQFSFNMTPSSIFFNFAKAGETQSATHFLAIKETTIDLQNMCALDDIAHELCYGKCSIEDAHKEIKRILNSKQKHQWLHIPLTVIANAALGSGLAVFMDGNWVELVTSFFAGIITGLMMVLAPKFELLTTNLRVVTSGCVSIFAVLVKLVLHRTTTLQINEVLIGISGFIFLVPSVTLLISTTELSSNNTVAGATRLLATFFAVFQLGFGILVGNTLNKLLSLPRYSLPREHLPVWAYALSLPVTVGCFMYLFRSPIYPAAIFFVYLSAACGFFSFYVCRLYVGGELSAFVGCFMLGLVANMFTVLVKHPANVVTISGVTLLLPGSLGVQSLYAIMNQDTAESMASLYHMVMGSLALTIGMTLSNYVLPQKYKLNL